MDESEILSLLRENNQMLKELLEITRRYTDPERIQEDNNNDFFMNVIANITAKQLEDKYGL